MTQRETLETTCKQFLDSLLGSTSRHVLCLNIAEAGFAAEQVAKDYLATKGTEATMLAEPSPTDFAALLGDLAGKVAIVTFDDLDKHPKCIDLLAEHVKQPSPAGRLVVVSRNWNSDNTPKERELRKACLFYQQSLAAKPKEK